MSCRFSVPGARRQEDETRSAGFILRGSVRASCEQGGNYSRLAPLSESHFWKRPHQSWQCISSALFIISLYLNTSFWDTYRAEEPPGSRRDSGWALQKAFVLAGPEEFFLSRLLGISSPPLGTSCYMSWDSAERPALSDWTFSPAKLLHLINTGNYSNLKFHIKYFGSILQHCTWCILSG